MCKKNNRSPGLYSVATAMGILLFLICIFLNEAALNQASLDPSVKETSFSYPSFDGDSCNTTLICMGSVGVGDRRLKLTPEPLPVDSNSTQPVLKDQIGRVLFHHPVIAWLSYINTTFTVRIFAFPNTTTNGDGMRFIMSQNNSPSPPDSEGSYLGVLTSGRDITVQIVYDSSTEELQIFVAYAGNPLVSFLNQSIDMSKWVPNSVYVGFTAATGSFSEAHEVLNWTFQSTSLPDLKKASEKENRKSLPDLKKASEKENRKRFFLTVAIVVAGLGVLILFTLPLALRDLRKRKERSKRRAEIESRSMRAANAPKMFTYRQLSKATLKFSKENLLGTGGFLSVYKGVISSDPPMILAVKKISATSRQGEKEYLAEICTTRSATDFGSKSDDVLLQSSPEEMVLDEIVVHHEDSDI